MKDNAVIFDLFGTLVDTLLLREYENILFAMAGVLGASPKDFARLWVETASERQTGVFPKVRTNVEHICRAECLWQMIGSQKPSKCGMRIPDAPSGPDLMLLRPSRS